MDDLNQAQPLIITATMLRLHLMCARRVWLDKYGDIALQDEITPITAFQLARGLQHEQDVHEATTEHMELLPVSSWAEGVQLTHNLIQAGVPAIIGAYLESTGELDTIPQPLTLRGKVDRLVRVPDRVKPIYAPIEIKRYVNVTQADLLQLDFYTLLLSTIQGVIPPAYFWLGTDESGRPSTELNHNFDVGRRMLLKFALTLVAKTLSDSSKEPPVRIEPHCRTCHWYTSCKTVLRNNSDIAIISGLRRDVYQRLRKAGLSTFDHLAASKPEELQKIKGIKKSAYGLIASAKAFLEDKPVWYNALPDICHQSGYLLDLETNPATGIPWCIGWRHEEGVLHIVVVASGHERKSITLRDGSAIILVPHVDDAWAVFAESVSNSDSPIYHWTSYDRMAMQRTARDKVKDRLLPRMHDLHRTFNQTVKLPERGTSLKVVAAYLGFSWSGFENWQDAYTAYLSWQRNRDVQFLTQARDYQRDDVEALGVVWKWLVANGPEAVSG